jgi:acetyl esterase
MTATLLETKTHAFDVEDVEYLRHGDKPLQARIYWSSATAAPGA